MTFLGIFGTKELDHEEFERQLSALSRDIAKLRNQITFLHRKRASVRSSSILYLTVAYVVVVAYRYRVVSSRFGILAKGKSMVHLFMVSALSKDMMIAFLGPVVLVLFVYMLDKMFRWLIRSKENSLKNIMKRHRDKLEELKQKTNFSKTNQLLQQYDTPSSTSLGISQTRDQKEQSGKGDKSGQKEQNWKGGKSGKSSQKDINEAEKELLNRRQTLINRPNVDPSGRTTPSTNFNGTSKNGSPNGPIKNTSDVLISSNQGPNSRSQPLRTPPHKTQSAGRAIQPQKGFQDRILDLIIGSEHNETVESRYALICAKCYTHNGLAPPGCTDPFSIIYFCRNCSFMNGKVENRPEVASASATSTPAEQESAVREPVESVSSNSESGSISLKTSTTESSGKEIAK